MSSPSHACPPPPRPVVVIDTDETWRRTVLATHRIVLVPPASAPSVASLAPACVVVNLAAPGALAALARLHGARGCLTAPEAAHAVRLGRIDVLAAPLTAAGVTATITGHTRRRARMVAAGRDAPSLLAVRHALARQGMGVSLGWDANQARDLVAMVRPDIVLIELDLPLGGGHAVVAELAFARPVPHLLLVPGRDDARAFSLAFARLHTAERMPWRHEVLGVLVGDAEAVVAPRPAPG